MQDTDQSSILNCSTDERNKTHVHVKVTICLKHSWKNFMHDNMSYQKLDLKACMHDPCAYLP